MALFGKKVKDGAPDLGADAGIAAGADSGSVAVADDPNAGHKKSKAARAPKAAKDKTVRNGVAVGLNIGNQFIKAVEVTSKNGELSVTAMGAVPTPAESYTNGNVLSVSALSGAIKDLWRGAGDESKVASTSVAGSGALVVRVIEVPRMSDGELGDNMKVDADRYIPFPPSEVVMDFKALRELPTDPDAPNMEVLLAAAQREIIDLHVQVVQKAKLDPRAIDVEPIAAARAMQLERRGESALIDYNEVTAIVNLGATGTEISILRGDILVFTRVVPGGGNIITQAIAEGLGLPFADAERVKIESADAQAPAGYGATSADGFGAGAGDDFNFGGEDFGSGSDLNSAFDDISANPPAPASDDPFDLDFFDQGPKGEPGAGHAQKPNEPGEETPAFNFSGFGFDAPTTESAAPQNSPAPESQTAATDAAAVNFNFGFDDLSDADLPSVSPADAETASPAASDKRTAQLEDFAAPSVEPASAQPQSAQATPSPSVLSGDFAMPSAFDFDNFDLPAAAAENSPVLAAPVNPAPAVAPPSDFGFGETSATSGLSGDAVDASIAPAAMSNDTASAAPSPFDFALGDASAASSLPEEAPLTPSPLVAASTASPDEFDLDAIFGASAPEANTAVAPGAEALGADSVSQPVGAPLVAPTPVSNDDFDLSGIDTGADDDFAGGFNQANDFSSFGAGLGASGDSADAAALYGLVYPSLEELAGEVRRSLEFHLGRYPDATISRLVLLGGGARLRNLDVFLTQMLGVPTTVANPFAHITVQTPKLAPGYAIENGPLCAVALGLALRDFVD